MRAEDILINVWREGISYTAGKSIVMSQTPEMRSVSCVVVRGRGAASGAREYAPLGGSIAAQKPRFKARGLDLSDFHNGTINLDISPKRFEVRAPRLTLRDIAWHPTMPPEDFSFCTAALEFGEQYVPALIYYPHPETKGPYGKMPPDTMIECLAPRVEGLAYGTEGVLWYDPAEVWIGD